MSANGPLLVPANRDGSRSRRLTTIQGLNRVLDELDKMNKVGQDWRVRREDVVISTNIRTRKDGLPSGNAREPADPGVAVYFEMDGEPYCMPCDRWDRVADNLGAIAAHIGALRGIERWGVGDLRTAFTGYKALLAPDESALTWWVVLGVSSTASKEEIHRAYRSQARTAHPDAGGDRKAWDVLQAAYEQALQQRQ